MQVKLFFSNCVIAAGLLGTIAHAADFDINGHKLTVPDGFEVELVAGPPLVERPISAAFDHLGRLYVTDSSGSNDKVEKQLAEKPHRIVRLEDTDGDGRFDRSIVFADKMMFPEGAMWLDGSLYVAAPPSIWKLTDTDNDGVADRREEWFKGKTLTGCANDLHGPYAGPDGWIYWCKGAFAEQKHTVRAKPFVTRASHIFRARPDGSGIEPVMTGGMDNPVEVAFTPAGERIFTTTFFQNPSGGQRDGLIHAIYGGVYGKQHDVLEGHTRTGGLMPVLTHLGAAAPSGLMRYEGRSFGDEYRDDLFATLFNLHKVTRHVLERDGATFKTRDEDFLTAQSTDFHPTDVLEDADGSVLILDTGGWYKLCCPTSQLYKPDVLGGIYRVRKRGAKPVPDPRGLSMAWDRVPSEEIVARLGDERPAVRARAKEEVVRRGREAVKPLAAAARSDERPDLRREALWALSHIDSADAREAVRGALADEDRSVAHAAAHVAGLWHDAGAVPQLLSVLERRDAALRRVAAEALGRVYEIEANDRASAGAVSTALLAALERSDRVLEHSVIFALISVNDRESLRTALGSGTPAARKAAVIALDQLSDETLTSEQLAEWLFSPDADRRDVGRWIARRHPAWGAELAQHFLQRPEGESLTAAEIEQAGELLALSAHDTGVQQKIADLISPLTNASQKQVGLAAMRHTRLKELPADWAAALVEKAETEPAEMVAVLRALPPPPKELLPKVRDALRRVAHREDADSDLRVAALAAIPAAVRELDELAFQFLTGQLAAETPLARRSAAAEVLRSARLSKEQQRAIARLLQNAAVSEIPKLLGAFERADEEELGLDVVKALTANRAIANLSPGVIKPRLNKFPASVQTALDAALAANGAAVATQRTQMDKLLSSLPEGDVRRGQALFNGTKAGCATCHSIGYLGGNLGPDLTKIGQVRNERDLLEAIVFPSATFVRSYEPAIVTTKSGDIHAGILRDESATGLRVLTGPGAEVRIARGDVDAMEPGGMSLMPQGYDQILTRAELADLLAFLKATKW